jgi:hypothetical protein
MSTAKNIQNSFGTGILLAIFMAGTSFAANEAEFNSPEQAVEALHKAVTSNDQVAIGQLIGPLGSSDDLVQDKTDRERFANKYSEMHRIVNQPDGTTVLFIGAENWPFPVPLVSKDEKWRFDVDAGVEEVMFRRIGENETTVIETCESIARGATNPPAGSVQGYQFRALGTQKGAVAIAYPSEYGSTGVMTFVASNGSVYEKDLGPETIKLASAITRYKADRTWHLVDQ